MPSSLLLGTERLLGELKTKCWQNWTVSQDVVALYALGAIALRNIALRNIINGFKLNNKDLVNSSSMPSYFLLSNIT